MMPRPPRAWVIYAVTLAAALIVIAGLTVPWWGPA